MANILIPKDAHASSIRNIAIIFGSLFQDLTIRLYDKTGNITGARRKVPLAWSAKQQYALWIEQTMRLPDGSIEVGRLLPRLSFELSSLARSAEESTNAALFHVQSGLKTNLTEARKIRTPVAYKFGFTLSAWCKGMDDSLQILNQILPVFNPEVSIKMKESVLLNIVNDVRIILNGITKNDSYADGFDSNRMIEWSMDFDVHANIVPTDQEAQIINKTIVNINNTIPSLMEKYVSEGIDPEFMNPELIEDRTYTIGDTIPEEDKIPGDE
jgi:hypothetical protein